MGSSGRNSKHKGREVVVVAHDAGGAEVIAAYVRAHRENTRYRIFAAGPAARVFARNRLPFFPAPRSTQGMRNLMKKSSDISFALLGTGWMTRIEWHALKEAKRARIKTAVYLDSWMNFREVFGYPKVGWRKNLPDEFWAGDRAGLSLAKHYFPRSKIRFVRNEYFSAILRRFRKGPRSSTDVIFMSAHGEISELLLKDFLSVCERRKIARTVRIRLHPADRRERYERIVRSFPGLHVVFSREKDIARDLLRARAVVGPETVALVPAFMLGIPTVRIVPPRERAFLPFPKIRKVPSAAGAAKLIFRKA